MAFQYVDYPQKMKDLLMQIFDDSFMQANTRFQSFEGFRYSSAVFVNWNSDCLIYDDALLDRFVQESTRFSTWDEMIQTATDLSFSARRLFLILLQLNFNHKEKESYTMGKTVLVDLSHPFGRGNPLWPSNGDFHIDRVQHMPMHYRLLQTFNDFHMHNSTHADSPSHVIPESPYTHELPLENYYGPAVCLDIPKKHWELITVEDIEKAAAKVEGGIQEGDWVLICTGMNQRWGENDDYFMYSPGMSIEGAHWLVDHKVKGVGFDLQALDHILYTYAAQHGPGPYVPRIVDEYKKEFGHEPIEDYPEWEPVHTILLGNNVMGIENLGGDIEKVKGQRFMFCAFPLRWYMGDGTIVRAVAITDEDHINKDVPDRVYKYGVY